MARSSERSLFVIRRQIRIARTLLVAGFLLVAGRGAVLPYLRAGTDAARAPGTDRAALRVASVPPATTAGLPVTTTPDEPPVVAPAPEPEPGTPADAAPVTNPAPKPPAPQLPQPPVGPPQDTAPTPARSGVAEPPAPRLAVHPPRRIPRTRPAASSERPTPRVSPAPPVEPPVVAPDPAPEDLVAAQPLARRPARADVPSPSPTVWHGVPGLELVISNPAESGGVVRFLLDGRTFALRPGATYTFAAEPPPVILFHRGGDFGDAGYSLTGGRYLFQVTARGWELFDDAPAPGRAAP